MERARQNCAGSEQSTDFFQPHLLVKNEKLFLAGAGDITAIFGKPADCSDAVPQRQHQTAGP